MRLKAIENSSAVSTTEMVIPIEAHGVNSTIHLLKAVTSLSSQLESWRRWRRRQMTSLRDMRNYIMTIIMLLRCTFLTRDRLVDMGAVGWLRRR